MIIRIASYVHICLSPSSYRLFPNYRRIGDQHVRFSAQGLGYSVKDCHNGMATIDKGATYGDQSQFSSGNYYLIYSTNRAGEQPVSGQVIYDNIQTVLNNCATVYPYYVGSYGTGNCPKCHVTVNYRF
ncbi:hypothetical protein K431DRAFT_291589 [Polychaeton citri CBS 116435]|uniref:Uncharacterized protein n=1 Tax=Polychaeton citri CBS 116435 TaxID=1314669 RepID=A0A9P4QDN1_9PEZI|nr:hypothetical protein K431DRAFT_291589 [Polychaeton citri CBS 116435]